MASCARIDGMVQAYVDGELSASDRVILEQHVGNCASCSERMRNQRCLSAELYETFSEHRLCRDLCGPVLENLPEMELPSAAIAGVNRRAKHPLSGWTVAGRYIPAAAIVVVAALGLMINQYWPTPFTGGPALGVVLQAKGHANCVPENSTAWSTTFAENRVQPGDRFETGDESTLMLGLKGPTVVKVNAGSRLKVDTERRISLEQGEVWLDIGRDGQLFRVVTPDGTITVFGTAFAVRVREGRTTVAVERGEVLIGTTTDFTNLRQGEQATMSTTQGLSKTERVTPDSIAKWAKAIVPEQRADRRFQELVLSHSAKTELPAQAVFFLDPSIGGRKWAVRAINVYWEADAHKSGHCSYDVYVCDDQMRPLFMERIPSSTFDDRKTQMVELPVPGEPIKDVRWLFVRLVPDMSTGTVEAKGLDVRAAASQL